MIRETPTTMGDTAKGRSTTARPRPVVGELAPLGQGDGRDDPEHHVEGYDDGHDEQVDRLESQIAAGVRMLLAEDRNGPAQGTCGRG